jgi:hypothetical protein
VDSETNLFGRCAVMVCGMAIALDCTGYSYFHVKAIQGVQN